MKLQIQVGRLPPNAIVTKVTGTYEYKVLESIRVYTVDGGSYVIEAEAGTKFLVKLNDPTSISSISDSKIVCWVLPEFLQQMISEELQHI